MRSVFMLLILLSALGGTGWYLSDRLCRGLAAFLPGMRLWPVMTIVCILLAVLVVGFGRALLPLPAQVKDVLGIVSGYCMGIFLYLLLFTVAADLLMLVLRLLKLPLSRELLRGWVTLGVLLLTAATCVYGFWNVRQIHQVNYEVTLQDRVDVSDLKLVLISDLHLGAIGSEDRLEGVVAAINEAEPDVVCIAGDFFDTDFSAIHDPERVIQTLRGIRSTYGVYACLGNHDGGQTHNQMVDFLGQANIQLLDDSSTLIDDRLVLVGRLDGAPIGGYGDRVRRPLSEIFTREEPDLPVIVMDHNPSHIDEYSTEADLILCGHTHRGQVFPGNLFTGMLYTVDYGYYRENAESPQVIVTSGIGAWGMPMRVGTDCEMVTIRFVKP